MNKTFKLLETVILITVLTVVVAQAIAIVPSANAIIIQGGYQFRGVLTSTGNVALIVTANQLTGSLSSGVKGILSIIAIPNGFTVTSCFRGTVTGTLQAPPTGNSADVWINLPGNMPSPPPANCPAGAFTLVVHTFTGATLLTVTEPSGPVQWSGGSTVAIIIQGG